MSANTTVYISLHPTRALSYTAVTGSTKELSIRTGTYNDTLVTEIDFAGTTYFIPPRFLGQLLTIMSRISTDNIVYFQHNKQKRLPFLFIKSGHSG